ncbi:MAG TPA: elongation factor G-like protein EF-G2 [Nocardioidaceae bacterium]|nr:elongation factor G-like protein EF-G2 [Actinomycetota bacterium]HEV8055348.1 elongation factor G-like protein EF-G2 [Nocardioidaceae bacterium]
MAERATNSVGAAGSVPRADRPDAIRNVVLVGASGSGKTSLAEALLVATGTLNRPGRVEDGTTVCDFEEAEHRQQRSIGLALAPFLHGGIKVNVLDTPGYADYVGELRAGLRAADCALFVIAANEGVDAATKTLWQECESVAMPRAVVVTKLDHQRADYPSVLDDARASFGDKVLPLYLPLRSGVLAGLLSQQVAEYDDHGRRLRSPDEEEALEIGSARGVLIEGVIEESEDETLMDRYMSGAEIDLQLLVDDLETAVARATFFPVVPVCASTGVGTAELLEVMTSAFPAPPEHAFPAVYTTAGATVNGLGCDPEGPLLAEVVKTTSDPYVGRVSLVRVFSGTLRADATVHVSGHLSQFFGDDRGHADHDVAERIGALSCPLGKTQRVVGQSVAGDIVAVSKLSHAETGDSLSSKDQPLLMEPWAMPQPLLPVAVQAHAKADEDKLSQGLTRLAAEDSTLRIEHNGETHQLVLWCMGEAHADVVLDRLEHRYGVKVDPVELRVPLRETFIGSGRGHGRHVKQSGGHGQYAVCDIEVEPLPGGGGFVFVDKVVGGSVPRQFIPSVEKGVRAQLGRGVVAGYPVVDLQVTLVEGKAHSVDSSDMAFQTAGALALRDAAEQAEVALLEPYDEVSVLVDDDYVGTVMGDLSSRRARVLGTEPVGQGRTLIKADAPQTEIVRYAVDLRSMSHGTGTFSREFRRYEPMPANLAAKMLGQPG